MKREIFVNLAVRDLPKSQALFGKVGFELDAKLTDENDPKAAQP